MKHYEVYDKICEILSSREVGDTVTINEIMSSLHYFDRATIRFYLRELACEGYVTYVRASHGRGHYKRPAFVYIEREIRC